MQMSKIKDIVLLILVLVNAALLLITGDQARQAEAYRQSALTSVVEALEKNGTFLDPSILPEGDPLPALTVDRDPLDAAEVEAEAGRVEALLGPCTREDGAVVRYRSARGQAELDSGGSFAVALGPGQMPLEGADPVEHGTGRLALLGFDGELVSRVHTAATDDEPEKLTLTYRQRWEGVPVFSSQAVLSYEDGVLRTMTGRMVAGTGTQVSTGTAITMPTVLSRFLEGLKDSGNVCSEITAVTAGYEAAGTRPVRLTPVWEIVADKQTRYHIDAVEGTFSRVE